MLTGHKPRRTQPTTARRPARSRGGTSDTAKRPSRSVYARHAHPEKRRAAARASALARGENPPPPSKPGKVTTPGTVPKLPQTIFNLVK
jgi:hypothetical protein